MTNYWKAIKLLYRVENPGAVQPFAGSSDKLEHELESLRVRHPGWEGATKVPDRAPWQSNSWGREVGRSESRYHIYRDEYLQLNDPNQDNYLEERLKIRNIPGEFVECKVPSQSPYAQWGRKDFKKSPVAIVGAREHIFSENIAILGDLPAGKE